MPLWPLLWPFRPLWPLLWPFRPLLRPCVPLTALMPFTAFTPLIPFLFFISTPPYSNEPPCSRGELIVCRRVVDKHGIMAGGYAEKSGRLSAECASAGDPS